MAIKLSNIMTGYVLMAIIFSLFVTIYVGFEDGYGIVRDGVDADGKNVVERLNDIDLIDGMNTFISGVYDIKNPGNIIDIIGGFLSAGIGIIQSLGGIIIIPFQLFEVLTDFYFIPQIIEVGFITFFSIYIGFAILNKFTGGDD